MVVPTERLYLLALGSRQGNAHVHWHVAPLPPGVPYEKQQYAALMHDTERSKVPVPSSEPSSGAILCRWRWGSPTTAAGSRLTVPGIAVEVCQVRDPDAEVESSLPKDGTAIVLVRHGRTALNAADRLRGRSEVPLDGVGRDEAARLARHFSSLSIEAIYSSPLARAIETAEIIADKRSIVIVDDRLTDRDYATWSGTSRAMVEEEFGSVDAAPGVEPRAAVLRRARSFLDDAVIRHRGQLLLAVAHDAVNRILIGALCSTTDAEPLPQPTGCWNLLTSREGDQWRAPVIGATPAPHQPSGEDAR